MIPTNRILIATVTLFNLHSVLFATANFQFCQTNPEPRDSLKAQQDTLATLKPLELTTSLLTPSKSQPDPAQAGLAGVSIIERTTIQWGDYSYLGELLWLIPGSFIRELGSAGQASQATLRGLGWHHVAFLQDGLLMSDAVMGTANLNFVPIANIQRVVYQTGVRSFLYGINSTGGAVNIITQDFFTNRPYSRIRYVEGGYSYLSTDGAFGQNFTRRLNFTGTFQRRTFRGRYPNSDHHAWNIHVKLRYLLSDRVNLIFSETYNGTQTGLNGGVDWLRTPAVYLFDELRATVRNTDAYEKVHRHHLRATIGVRPRGDSAATSTATAYYSSSLRQYRDEENRPNPNGIFIQSDHRSEWFGLKFGHRIKLRGTQIDLETDLQNRRIISSPNVDSRHETLFALAAQTETAIRPILAGFFGRYDHLRGEGFLSYGTDVRVDFLSSDRSGLQGYAGYSVSYRTPTIQEFYWKGSGISRAGPLDGEKHRLFEAGLRSGQEETTHFRITYFQRKIQNRIIADLLRTGQIFPGVLLHNVSEEIFRGVDGMLGLQVWKFAGRGTFLYLIHNRKEIEERIYPRFSASGEIAFRTRLFRDHLDLKVGVKGRFFTSHNGEQFNPESMMYVENTATDIGQHGSADLFLVGKVGSAYFHILVENLTNQRYMLTPFFPMQDRKIRFGVEWEFLD